MASSNAKKALYGGFVVLFLCSQAIAHMVMASPKPFGTPDNSPLSSSGANFPCKVTGEPGVFFGERATGGNVMAAGATQTLSFKGSAVHGGGSCQLAITAEKQPSPSTAWEVILSIEGGCPSKDGSGPSTYDFSIPPSVAPGDYVFAWTWISKLAGQPEYYMNCAPIKVTAAAAAGKRSEADFFSPSSSSSSSSSSANESGVIVRRDDVLPPLGVFNLASINDCKVGPGVDPVFPAPGPNVLRPGSASKFTPPTGTDCFAKGVTFSASASSIGGGNSSSSSSSESESGSGNGNGNSSPSRSSGSNPGQSQYTSSPSGNPGAVYLSSPTTMTTEPGAGGPTTFRTSASAATTTNSPAAESEAVTATETAPSSGMQASETPAGSAPSPSGLFTGPCVSEGVFNCLDGTSYQRCASGSWTPVMAMPGGTNCALGQTMTLWARGLVRGRRMLS